MKIKRKPKKKVVMSFGIQSLKKNKGKIGVSKQFKLKVPSYLTSHSKPHKLRKFVADKKRLNRMDKSSVIPSLMIGKPKYISKKNLTWPQAKRRFPLMNPYRDTDRDGVKNIFDCRPFDKRRQHVYYHGTSSALAEGIKKEGLKPSRELPEHYKTSDKTERDKVYVFKQPHHAQSYARGVTQQVGFGKPEVLEVDIDESEVERDYEVPFGEAYKKEGKVEAEKIKEFEGDVSYPKEDETYDVDDSDDKTLDYKEEEETKEEEDD